MEGSIRLRDLSFGARVGVSALVALFSFLIRNPPQYMVDALATVSALMLVVIIYFVMSASMSMCCPPWPIAYGDRAPHPTWKL